LGKGDNLFFAAGVIFSFVLACHAEASVRRLVLEKISITITRTTTRISAAIKSHFPSLKLKHSFHQFDKKQSIK